MATDRNRNFGLIPLFLHRCTALGTPRDTARHTAHQAVVANGMYVIYLDYDYQDAHVNESTILLINILRKFAVAREAQQSLLSGPVTVDLCNYSNLT
jgi:hypothetical protein